MISPSTKVAAVGGLLALLLFLSVVYFAKTDQVSLFCSPESIESECAPLASEPQPAFPRRSISSRPTEESLAQEGTNGPQSVTLVDCLTDQPLPSVRVRLQSTNGTDDIHGKTDANGHVAIDFPLIEGSVPMIATLPPELGGGELQFELDISSRPLTARLPVFSQLHVVFAHPDEPHRKHMSKTGFLWIATWPDVDDIASADADIEKLRNLRMMRDFYKIKPGTGRDPKLSVNYHKYLKRDFPLSEPHLNVQRLSIQYTEKEALLTLPFSGKVVLCLSMKGAESVKQVHELMRGEIEESIVAITPTPRITGVVRDSTGNSVRDAPVTVICRRKLLEGAHSPANAFASFTPQGASFTYAYTKAFTTTDADGGFVLFPNFSGEMMIYSCPLGSKPGIRKLQVTPGFSNHNVVLLLKDPARGEEKLCRLAGKLSFAELEGAKILVGDLEPEEQFFQVSFQHVPLEEKRKTVDLRFLTPGHLYSYILLLEGGEIRRAPPERYRHGMRLPF